MRVHVETEALETSAEFTGHVVTSTDESLPFEGVAEVALDATASLFSEIGDLMDESAWDIPYTAGVTVRSGAAEAESFDSFTAFAGELMSADEITRHCFYLEDRLVEACEELCAKLDANFDRVECELEYAIATIADAVVDA